MCGCNKATIKSPSTKAVYARVPAKVYPNIKVCPKCRYPMNVVRKFVPTANKQVVVTSCTNKACGYRTEA